MNDRGAFFVTGGTMPREALSYVERQADSQLLDGLRRGEFCYVLTSRQMGKSSLMVRTAARLRAEGAAIAVLDLTGLGQNLTVEQWYWGLLNRLGRHLDIEEEVDRFWHDHDDLSPLARWMAAIQEVVLVRRTGRVVIFIDEIDVVRSLPFSADELFAAIRSFYNRRAEEPQLARLTFCLLGVASAADLIRDPQLTPFNVGRRIILNDFTPMEAASLANGFGDPRTGASVLKRVLYWTNGHPYLTQKLCSALAESGSALSSQTVDRLCSKLFLARRAWEQDENLLFVRDQLLRSSDNLFEMLYLYRSVLRGQRIVDDETSRLVTLLRLSGVAGTHRRRLYVRNRIYEQVFDRGWVALNMPDAEALRHRAAYRRGLLRATLVCGAFVVILAAVSTVAFRQRRRAEQIAESTQRLYYIADMNVVAQALDQHDVMRARAVLDEHKNDRWRGFEWGYLWRQAHREAFSVEPNDGPVTAIGFSPTANLLATGGLSGRVQVWNAQTGVLIRTLPSAGEQLVALSFSPDGRWIATGGASGTLSIRDAVTGEIRRLLNGSSPRQPSPMTCVSFGPAGRLIAASDLNGRAYLYDASGRDISGALPMNDSVTGLEFSTAGGWLACAHSHGITLVYLSPSGIRTRMRKLPLGGRTPSSVAASPNGSLVATAENDGVVRVRNVATGKVVRALGPLRRPLSRLAFSGDGKWLAAVGDDNAAYAWALWSNEPALVFDGHRRSIPAVALSGQRLATGSMDGEVKVWDLETEPSTVQLANHLNNTTEDASFSLSPNGRVAAMYSSHSVQLLDAETGSPLGAPIEDRTHPVSSITFSAGGGLLLVGRQRRALAGYTVPGGHEQSLSSEPLLVSSPLALSPNGEWLAASSDDPSDHAVYLRNIRRSGRTLRLSGHTKGVKSASFSPDGAQLTTTGIDRSVRLWDVNRGTQARTLPKHGETVTDAVYSPDGRRLAVASGSDIHLWDTETGREMLVLPTKRVRLVSVAFADAGRTVRAIDQEGVMVTWRSANHVPAEP